MIWLKQNWIKVGAGVLILVFLFLLKTWGDSPDTALIGDTVSLSPSPSPTSTPETTPTPTPLPEAGPNAVFKEKVNDMLYRYYPLSVGTKWVYEDWTYNFGGSDKHPVYVKEVAELTITVSKIYEENGKEYVELDRVHKITDWFEVNEPDDPGNPDIKIYRKIPFPEDEKLIFNTTAILEIVNSTVKYIHPKYPDYIDTFPLKAGILADLREGRMEQFKASYGDEGLSAYGEEALVWKREKTDNYKIKGTDQEFENCYRSFAYDRRGASGSREEIVFCEGVGPVKHVSELIAYTHHSYYGNLVDFERR